MIFGQGCKQCVNKGKLSSKDRKEFPKHAKNHEVTNEGISFWYKFEVDILRFPEMVSKLFWILLGFCSVQAAQGAYTLTTASLLHTSLTFDYNTELRPSDTVNVTVTLTLDSINYIDFEKMTLSAEGWITSSWTDGRFTWTPASNGDIDYMFMTKVNCWKPTLIIDNELSNQRVLNDDSLSMRVGHDGKVTWEQPHVFNVHCDLDSTRFPFDKQTCFIYVGIAGYDKTAVTLIHGADDVITTRLTENSEWTLEKTSVTSFERADGSGQFISTHLSFTVELTRNGAWYVTNIIVPVVMTSLLGLGVFLIPVESDEKMLYTSSVFVVNAIFSWITSSLIPTSSSSTPLLGVFMVSILCVNGLEMILTIITIRIYNKQNRARNVPLASQAIVKKIKRVMNCCFRADDAQTREILDLTKDDRKKSQTLKSKFSVKSQNKVGPSPPPTTTGYQRMESAADSSPSVDPELDGRTNLPSNSRYRPSSYTQPRPTSQAQDRPSSCNTPARPMSLKSVGGIYIREKSFLNDDTSTGYQQIMNNFVTNQSQNNVQHTQEVVVNDVTSDGMACSAHIEKRPSERSNKQVQMPSKPTSFRSNLGKDENVVTWVDVSKCIDFVSFISLVIVKVLVFAVICALYMLK